MPLATTPEAHSSFTLIAGSLTLAGAPGAADDLITVWCWTLLQLFIRSYFHVLHNRLIYADLLCRTKSLYLFQLELFRASTFHASYLHGAAGCDLLFEVIFDASLTKSMLALKSEKLIFRVLIIANWA